jgi:hypothetical protein
MPINPTLIDEIMNLLPEKSYWGDARAVFIKLGIPEETHVSEGARSRQRRYLEAAAGAAADAILRYFEVGPYATKPENLST